MPVLAFLPRYDAETYDAPLASVGRVSPSSRPGRAVSSRRGGQAPTDSGPGCAAVPAGGRLGAMSTRPPQTDPGPDSEPSPASADPGWVIVVPVKGGPLAKSRLRAPDGVDHARLATALALDTLTAAVGAVGSHHVVVVTSDPDIAAEVRRLGVVVEAHPADGLDAAVLAGAARAGTLPGAGEARVAALLGDLPCLQADDLLTALAVCEDFEAAVVPDADGVGTVLLAARSGPRLHPRFGGPSAHSHELGGAQRLDLDLPRLRRDVDDEASLRAALCLGVGTATATLLAHLLVSQEAPTP